MIEIWQWLVVWPGSLIAQVIAPAALLLSLLPPIYVGRWVHDKIDRSRYTKDRGLVRDSRLRRIVAVTAAILAGLYVFVVEVQALKSTGGHLLSFGRNDVDDD